jgi:hypothetical protein
LFVKKGVGAGKFCCIRAYFIILHLKLLFETLLKKHVGSKFDRCSFLTKFAQYWHKVHPIELSEEPRKNYVFIGQSEKF